MSINWRWRLNPNAPKRHLAPNFTPPDPIIPTNRHRPAMHNASLKNLCPKHREGLRFLRFGLVGLLNTALTFFLFAGLRALGVGVDMSNLLSYAAGMLNSFVCNKLWVFRCHGSRWRKEALLFFAGTGGCWALQWCCFRMLLTVMPEMWAQLCGMGCYTLLNFVYNRQVAFHQPPQHGERGR